MTSELKAQVIELTREGVEPKEIVNQLDVSLATVYRWVKQASENGDLEDVEIETPNEKELIDYKATNDNEITLLAGKKRRALKKHNKLFKKLLLNVEGSRWADNDLEEQILEMEEMQDTIEEILDFDKEKFEANALWQSLQVFIDRFEEMATLSRKGVDILFDYEDDRLEEIEKIIALDEFDTEFDFAALGSLETEREKCQLVQELLNHEEESLNEEKATELLTRVKVLRANIKENNEYGEQDETLTVLKTLTKGLKGVLREIEDSIIWKTGTLNYEDDFRAEMAEHCTVNISSDA